MTGIREKQYPERHFSPQGPSSGGFLLLALTPLRLEYIMIIV